jgi:hypothetical protein
MSQIDLDPQESARNSPDGDGLWPALVNIYHEQGYEAGYARAISDALATVVESAEQFLRSRPESDLQARKLLYAYSEFLEARVRETTAAQNHPLFIDGLGI